MAKIEHFEIPADDVARAQTFYGGVFGFSFDKRDDENVMIRPGEGGIGGDIHKRSEDPEGDVIGVYETSRSQPPAS
ncbi:MAG TPA: VOC family protein [Galbitalea sp.]